MGRGKLILGRAGMQRKRKAVRAIDETKGGFTEATQ